MGGLSQSMKPNPVKTGVAAVVAQVAVDSAAAVARAGAVMEVVAADVVATKPASTSINRTAPEGSDMPSGAILFHIADQ